MTTELDASLGDRTADVIREKFSFLTEEGDVLTVAAGSRPRIGRRVTLKDQEVGFLFGEVTSGNLASVRTEVPRMNKITSGLWVVSTRSLARKQGSLA